MMTNCNYYSASALGLKGSAGDHGKQEAYSLSKLGTATQLPLMAALWEAAQHGGQIFPFP